MQSGGGVGEADLVSAFRGVGLEPGDVVFLHVCLEGLGGGLQGSGYERCTLLLNSLRRVIGSEGTILVPTYTFSFCRGEPFDPQTTPSEGGAWSTSVDFLEWFRHRPGAVRSRDPIHSVAGLGPRAPALLQDVAPTCFGRDSVFDRLRRVEGKICLIGVGLYEASFLHHVEEVHGVPFRFKKVFSGQIREDGRSQKTGWIYNVRILADNSCPDEGRLEIAARRGGILRAARVGEGEIIAIGAQQYFDLVWQQLQQDSWVSARGPAGDPLELERARVGERAFCVDLPANASMPVMVDALWRLPRDIVSEGYDVALSALATQIPMTIHEYPTGTECWTWIVPEKWTCHEAYLETLDGRRLFSYADHPLHVVSYSLPFEGTVTRTELLAHLHVHHQRPDAVPFIFKYYERDWGLCCSQEQREALTDESYRVVIRTSFSYATLKVGEMVVPGTSDESIVLCAHLCHPAMANDDLSGVVVGVDVMRQLQGRGDLHYTYRLLIVPETIGSVAWLSHNESLVPTITGGLFLEMLGAPHPHALQLSFDGRSEVDRCCMLTLRDEDAQGWTGRFGSIIGNDERQFNSPGVRVPMLSLSRVLPATHPEWPYLGYHSSHDNPGLISEGSLTGSRELVLRMIHTLEHNVTPVNRFKGEVFCSRYGIHADFWADREGNKTLFDVMYLIDGTRSAAQIAETCGGSFSRVMAVLDELRRHGLVEYTRPRRAGPDR
jgi:aminopeptidase-like protein/aminoglycoside N3'-acetyltransferase